MVDSGSLSAAMSLPEPGLFVVVIDVWGKPWLDKPFSVDIGQYTKKHVMPIDNPQPRVIARSDCDLFNRLPGDETSATLLCIRCGVVPVRVKLNSHEHPVFAPVRLLQQCSVPGHKERWLHPGL